MAPPRWGPPTAAPWSECATDAAPAWLRCPDRRRCHREARSRAGRNRPGGGAPDFDLPGREQRPGDHRRSRSREEGAGAASTVVLPPVAGTARSSGATRAGGSPGRVPGEALARSPAGGAAGGSCAAGLASRIATGRIRWGRRLEWRLDRRGLNGRGRRRACLLDRARRIEVSPTGSGSQSRSGEFRLFQGQATGRGGWGGGAGVQGLLHLQAERACTQRPRIGRKPRSDHRLHAGQGAVPQTAPHQPRQEVGHAPTRSR